MVCQGWATQGERKIRMYVRIGSQDAWNRGSECVNPPLRQEKVSSTLEKKEKKNVGIDHGLVWRMRWLTKPQVMPGSTRLRTRCYLFIELVGALSPFPLSSLSISLQTTLQLTSPDRVFTGFFRWSRESSGQFRQR